MMQLDSTEVPVLSAETMAQIRRDFSHAPIPPEHLEVVTSAFRAEPQVTLVERHDVTMNGEPTHWMVWDDDGDALTWTLWGRIPCSVSWCEVGHDPDEADTWEEITHNGKEHKVSGPLDGLVFAAGRRGEKAWPYVYLKVEDELTHEEAKDLQVALYDFAALVAQVVTECREIGVVE